MAMYVLSKRGGEFLETPVYRAGENGQEEAVGVFTDRARAEQYLQDAGWQDSDEVAELSDLQVLRWMLQAHQEGAEYLVVNPNREAQMEGTEQPVIQLGEQLESAAASLRQRIQP